jgi:hypothetical protein
MAASRLSDSQKTELVARFRAGEGSQVLAGAYGCSSATVIRVVRAALDPAEYERLKQQGGRRAAPIEPQSPPAHFAPLDVEVALARAEAVAPEPLAPQDPDAEDADSENADDENADAEEGDKDETEEEEAVAPQGVLAIDDADDFGADDDAEHDSDDDLLLDDDDEGDGDDSDIAGVTASLGLLGSGASAVQVRPLADATLPASAYMLVDKTVELQARPLSDFPELGALAPEELQLQALVVYLNPRQAKRQCGRSQRVIKIPDPQVFQRTSRFLVAQGISRVLIEGSLYSLSGS